MEITIKELRGLIEELEKGGSVTLSLNEKTQDTNMEDESWDEETESWENGEDERWDEEDESWEDEDESWEAPPCHSKCARKLGLVIGYGEHGCDPKTIKIDSWAEFDDLHAALHAVERYKG